jgi:uncharacterized protein
MNPGEIRFAADAMLQLLAIWIRMLGYDCTADRRVFGRALLEKAVAERRWVLTRNHRFGQEMPVALLSLAEIHLLASERLPEQLREVADRFALEPEAFRFTRCLVCNEPLLRVAKSQVAQVLPPAVMEKQDPFWRCPRCGRIFWRGSHVRHSGLRLDEWLGAA